jgi:cytochrome c oxidase subunit 4
MAKDDAKSKGKKADEKKPAADEKASVKKTADTKEAPAKEAPAKAAAKAAPEKAAAHSAAKEAAHDDHGHGDHAHGAHGAHVHKVDRKEVWKIFAVLFALTVLEVAVAQVPGVGKVPLYIALIGLALTKAACVGLYYMHLKHETKYLKMTVALPFAAPTVYALVLIAEGAWRATW